MTLPSTAVGLIRRTATTLGVVGSLLATPWASAACTRPIVIAASPGLNLELDKDNRPSGLVPDFFQYLQARTGCQFTYLYVPHARALRMFEEAQVDLISSLVQTPERDRWGRFVPVAHIRASLITLANEKIQDPLFALENGDLRVDAVRGFNYGPAYQALLTKLRAMNKLQEVTDAATVIRKIKLGRTDATIMVASILVNAASENQMNDVLRGTVVPNLPVSGTGFYLSTKRLDPESLATLHAAFQNKVHLAYFWQLLKARMPAWALSSVESIQ
ncbi:MAG: transporter substrate-binding domain-containing protein [Rhodoferax sp.]|nr:transporter substrate-binding domain-containing protein [Rhodoferax sp.]